MIVHKFFTLSFLVLLISTSSCQSKQEETFKDTSPTYLKELLDKKSDITIVDIRTPKEIKATGKIPGSVTIDFYDPAFKAKIAALPKDKPVYVYCAAGGRSSKSIEKFKAEGFSEAHSVVGGMGKWQSLKYPVE